MQRQFKLHFFFDNDEAKIEVSREGTKKNDGPYDIKEEVNKTEMNKIEMNINTN